MSRFRTVEPNGKGYPGLTAIALDNGRELVMMGCGPEVEEVLIAEALKRRGENVEEG